MGSKSDSIKFSLLKCSLNSTRVYCKASRKTQNKTHKNTNEKKNAKRTELKLYGRKKQYKNTTAKALSPRKHIFNFKNCH
jgi:hypothetical protein